MTKKLTKIDVKKYHTPQGVCLDKEIIYVNQTIMKVEKNKVVSVNYALRTSENGPIVEQTSDDHLLEFLFGRGMMLQKFEDNLNGLEEGQKVSFHLTP